MPPAAPGPLPKKTQRCRKDAGFGASLKGTAAVRLRFLGRLLLEDRQKPSVLVSPVLFGTLEMGASIMATGAIQMGTASGPFSSVDDQIFACIEAAKTWDKDAKIEDFQLRVVENELVLVHLKSRRTYIIKDEESDLPDLEEVQERFPDLVPAADWDQPRRRSRHMRR